MSCSFHLILGFLKTYFLITVFIMSLKPVLAHCDSVFFLGYRERTVIISIASFLVGRVRLSTSAFLRALLGGTEKMIFIVL